MYELTQLPDKKTRFNLAVKGDNQLIKVVSDSNGFYWHMGTIMMKGVMEIRHPFDYVLVVMVHGNGPEKFRMTFELGSGTSDELIKEAILETVKDATNILVDTDLEIRVLPIGLGWGSMDFQTNDCPELMGVDTGTTPSFTFPIPDPTARGRTLEESWRREWEAQPKVDREPREGRIE